MNSGTFPENDGHPKPKANMTIGQVIPWCHWLRRNLLLCSWCHTPRSRSGGRQRCGSCPWIRPPMAGGCSERRTQLFRKRRIIVHIAIVIVMIVIAIIIVIMVIIVTIAINVIIVIIVIIITVIMFLLWLILLRLVISQLWTTVNRHHLWHSPGMPWKKITIFKQCKQEPQQQQHD